MGMSMHGFSRKAGGFTPPLPRIRNACFLPSFEKRGIRRRGLVIAQEYKQLPSRIEKALSSSL
jgi:hypothetical protein